MNSQRYLNFTFLLVCNWFIEFHFSELVHIFDWKILILLYAATKMYFSKNLLRFHRIKNMEAIHLHKVRTNLQCYCSVILTNALPIELVLTLDLYLLKNFLLKMYYS